MLRQGAWSPTMQDKADDGGLKASKKDKRSNKSKSSSKVKPPKAARDNTPKVGFLSFKVCR
jgi:hypothetical protein